ncbi:MAG: hypothetical protein ACTSR2_06345 [Candidatus Hodarchaeales archaeon]
MNPEGSERLPCELSPGKNLFVWRKESDIIKGLKASGFKGTVKISGVYKDAVGNSYSSKNFRGTEY